MPRVPSGVCGQGVGAYVTSKSGTSAAVIGLSRNISTLGSLAIWPRRQSLTRAQDDFAATRFGGNSSCQSPSPPTTRQRKPPPATSSTRALVLGLLLLWVWVFSLHRGAWLPWSRDALRPAALRAVLGVGLPVALQVSLEIWAFSAATLLAGRLGATAAAAHTIALNMAALAFMMPLGISQGAVTRVGNLLGASRPRAAQIAAWVATGLGASVMTLSAIAFVSLRDWLPTLYTPDAGVVLLCASILPIAAAFQIFDGTQVVGCGVLRGMGRTRPAAWFNLLGYWILGLPASGGACASVSRSSRARSCCGFACADRPACARPPRSASAKSSRAAATTERRPPAARRGG